MPFLLPTFRRSSPEQVIVSTLYPFASSRNSRIIKNSYSIIPICISLRSYLALHVFIATCHRQRSFLLSRYFYVLCSYSRTARTRPQQREFEGFGRSAEVDLCLRTNVDQSTRRQSTLRIHVRGHASLGQRRRFEFKLKSKSRIESDRQREQQREGKIVYMKER